MSIITTMAEIEKLLKEMRDYTCINASELAVEAYRWREKAVKLLNQLEDK